MPSTIRTSILLLDDQTRNLPALEGLMNNPDLNIVKAASGDEACRLTKEQDFALVLLDARTSSQSKSYIAKLVDCNADTSRIPIILLSVSSKENMGVFKGCKAGIVDCLFEPLDPEILQNKVDNYVNLYRQSLELHEANKRLKLGAAERRLAEEEKSRLESQLRQSQKMEAVGQLAGGVAHDFNNLLTGIICNVSLALMDLQPGDPLAKKLTEIGDSCDRAANLTRQLLAFSRKQIIKPKVISLNELIENLRKMLTRLIGEDIELFTAPKKWLKRVKADPGQIEQIIVNLAVNARDSMPGCGKLAIGTADVTIDEDGLPNQPSAKPGHYVMISVSDTGHGMDDETKKRIFEPFFTTKSNGKGTGLGLSTVYGAIRQNQGFIEVYSEVGMGTTFNIYLPAIMEKAEAIPRKKAGDDFPTGAETIMVVEDDHIVRELNMKILERLGYRVITAKNGREAYRLTEKEADGIDLLLTDVVMPEMNGGELAKRLNNKYPKMKVLFTSGYTDDMISQRNVLEKGVHFIGKPYAAQALASKVRDVLNG